MSTICAHFCKLMDLPPYIAVTEAKSKLSDTYLIINGELMYVENINDDRIQVLKENYDGEYTNIRGRDIISIEYWLPLSGIYMIEGIPVHLWKIPKRQWRKSFSWNYYTSTHGSVNAYDIFKSKPMELYKHGEKLMYYDICIGKFSDDKIIPLIPEFEFEITLYKEHVRGKV